LIIVNIRNIVTDSLTRVRVTMSVWHMTALIF